MCVVSNVGDYARRDWEDWFKQPQVPTTFPYTPPVFTPKEVTREEFEALKKRVEELHLLLQAAKRYDDATGQPHCEVDEKVAIIKKIAEHFGVDMKDVFDE